MSTHRKRLDTFGTIYQRHVGRPGCLRRPVA